MTNSLPIELKTGQNVRAVNFSANGEHLFTGCLYGVEVWHVQDGQHVTTINTKGALCQSLAVSKDGNWIAGGTNWGELFLWDARTFGTVWKMTWRDGRGITATGIIHAVDFDPDSARMVSGSPNGTATIWDIASGEKAGKLRHKQELIAAKYSPYGDRIATATRDGSVHVWDSSSGRLLLDIPVKVTAEFNNGLLWFGDSRDIVVITDSAIERLNALTGSTVSEWSVPAGDAFSCIALPKHGKFIAHSNSRMVSFWDISTHSQLGLVEHPEAIRVVALSPDNKSLAIGGGKLEGKVIIGRLDSLPLSSTDPTLRDIDIHINHGALDAWKRDQLNDVETSLNAAIRDPRNASHHLLAARALVRARLGRSEDALVDANKAIEMQPSLIAYIAKSLAHVRKGDKDEAYRACDIAFVLYHSSHAALLFLIKAIIVFMAGEYLDAISRIDDPIKAIPSDSIYRTVQAYMYLLQGNTHLDQGNYENAIHFLERARAQTRLSWNRPPLLLSLLSGWKLDILHITARQRLCEAFYAADRRGDAGAALLEMVNTFDEEVYTSDATTKWVCHFTHLCLTAPEITADESKNTDAKILDATATMLLRPWAQAKLMHDSWQNALSSAIGYAVSRFTVVKVICERLEMDTRTTDAALCFRYMLDELVDQENLPHEAVKWVINFRHRRTKKFEKLGDVATKDERHDDAISHYSAAMSLIEAAPQELLIKRNKAYLAKGFKMEALHDANRLVQLYPLSPWGYERKHATLHEAGHYEAAVKAFETMLSKMSESTDQSIRALHRKYVNPAKTTGAIRKAVQDAIRDLPRVLINTSSGRLCDKTRQAMAFESHPIFYQLVSSMTTHIDEVCIRRNVAEYYRYGMFSHKWENNEPLFELVMRVAVYDLKESPTHEKLKTFCNIVRDAGLKWAWSDTCCINRADHFILQEALVSMFKWYQGSDLTIVFLFDVLSPSRRGDLVKSIWNSRAWTFQEYHASKVVQFYTKDWEFYMNLSIPNHKDSPEINAEMEEATGVSARALTAIRPGLDDIREKLCLASSRKTTLVEDAAYSLLGIFSMSLPVVYGEGDHALGRLLAQLLTSSGDASILAWTGKSGSFNSCLPTSITVFKHLPHVHIPCAIAPSEMEKLIFMLRASSLNPTLLMQLLDRLHELPVPSFSGQRMKLPCFVFKLGSVAVQDARQYVFRAQTDVLGIVNMKTREDLSQFHPLYLVHPWIDFLLSQRPVGSVIQATPEANTEDQSAVVCEPRSPAGAPNTVAKRRASRFTARFALPFGGLTTKRPKNAASLLPPSTLSEEDKLTRALQIVARLQQPFGALLLTRNPGKVAAYKRVAAETLITVKVEEITTAVLSRLVSSVRVLDVL